MFFKSKPTASDNPSQAWPQTHIDQPRCYPRATLFQVVGWVTSDSSIESVRVGGETMQLTERPDVQTAHPNAKHVNGFCGLARELDIVDGHLVVTIQNQAGQHTRQHALSHDMLFALSKREKLDKFRKAFPGDDPDKLIDHSRAVEVSNDDPVKHETLKAILKCPECGEVGLVSKNGAPSCRHGHSVKLIGLAYNTLSQAMRAEHNIINNTEAASRAQDPLAVALIGKYRDGLILDCGSGLPFQNYRNVVNFDIEKFANTDVIGVGEELPFADDAFDAVFSFSVLEHVKNPFRCASEIKRVLKPSGIVYCSVPFLIPVHGYPHHYYNMTQQGLANLFEDDISILQSGVPSSGHPLFALNSVANIWCDALTDDQKQTFRKLSVGDLIDNPAKLMEEDYCSQLPQHTQAMIACTNMIIGKKR